MKWGFFAGLGVGTAVGMLVAPKSGVELREDIQDFARENLNREKLDSMIDQGRERIQPLVDEARQRVEPVLNQARERVQPVVDEARERVQPMIDQAREKVQPMVDQAREKVEPVLDDARERVQAAVDSAREKAEGLGSSLMEVINEWPHERLIEIDGIGPVLATKIIQGRPYEREEDLAESKTLPPSAIESLRKAA
jgi:gas vesicle protein